LICFLVAEVEQIPDVVDLLRPIFADWQLESLLGQDQLLSHYSKLLKRQLTGTSDLGISKRRKEEKEEIKNSHSNKTKGKNDSKKRKASEIRTDTLVQEIVCLIELQVKSSESTLETLLTQCVLQWLGLSLGNNWTHPFVVGTDLNEMNIIVERPLISSSSSSSSSTTITTTSCSSSYKLFTPSVILVVQIYPSLPALLLAIQKRLQVASVVPLLAQMRKDDV
jgi:hypothetical protein